MRYEVPLARWGGDALPSRPMANQPSTARSSRHGQSSDGNLDVAERFRESG